MAFASVTAAGPHRVSVLRAPFSARTWRETAYLLIGLPVALLLSAGLVLLAALTVLVAPTVVLVRPAARILVRYNRMCTAVARSRAAGLLGLRLAPAGLSPAATWRQLGHHLLAGPLAFVEFLVVLAFWSTGLTLATAFGHAWLLPADALFGLGVRQPVVLAGLTVTGIAVVLATPWLVRAVAWLDVAITRALLEPGPRERITELTGRVGALTRSRAELAEAAEAERRRIERDLHDGAQQRLVALAMNLGMVRRAVKDLPEPVRDAITQAHEDAQLTLTELRDLVRGLHPAVLDDLGLDAALSGIAARSPVPARLSLELPHRPPRPVEAVAYFVVSEALANVVKHAAAEAVEVSVRHAAEQEVLYVTVSDNGIGGADPDRGSGLRGLAQRVRSADGTLDVHSPAGGPTVIRVELPCGS